MPPQRVAMLMLHGGTPRDREARAELARALAGELPEHWRPRSARAGG